MKLLDEFKAFAMRGNVVDMAVGIIIGAAFGKIISSLVSDVIMPPLGLLLGRIDFSDMTYVMKEAVIKGEETIPAVTLNYGMFIQNVVDFLIIAFAIFMVIKAMNSMKRKKEAAEQVAAPPPPSKEEELLAEIRDLLKK
ncbi:large-conductance mechanosensitive channel protein MscL [Lentimicrobium sp.]